MDIAQWLIDTRMTVEQWIQEDFPFDPKCRGTVDEAMRYSLLAGGKRLRPQLVLASAMYLRHDPGRFRNVALAIEYLHTYSLIHDDLPAMDNDDLRRGMPTSHKVYGEAMAILSGDALLTEAFAKMSRLAVDGFPAASVVDATRELAVAAGRHGLIQGQVKDLAAEGTLPTAEALADIHRHKTGMLIQACLVIPAILANDSEKQARLQEFGLHFGLAFQIADDILNVIGDASVLGKATGTDVALKKATYPRILGLDEAKRLAQMHQELADAALGHDESAGVLRQLLRFAVERQW